MSKKKVSEPVVVVTNDPLATVAPADAVAVIEQPPAEAPGLAADELATATPPAQAAVPQRIHIPRPPVFETRRVKKQAVPPLIASRVLLASGAISQADAAATLVEWSKSVAAGGRVQPEDAKTAAKLFQRVHGDLRAPKEASASTDTVPREGASNRDQESAAARAALSRITGEAADE